MLCLDQTTLMTLNSAWPVCRKYKLFLAKLWIACTEYRYQDLSALLNTSINFGKHHQGGTKYSRSAQPQAHTRDAKHAGIPAQLVALLLAALQQALQRRRPPIFNPLNGCSTAFPASIIRL